MKIYTKGGDAGETGLYGGERVSKDHQRIRTYGTLDELNSALGLAQSAGGLNPKLSSKLSRVQGELFQLGAELATPQGKEVKTVLIDQLQIELLENEIDSMEAILTPLKTFILPGGTPGASFLHLARSISRRAERELVSLHYVEPVRSPVMQYVNRLSDYLFVCARFANHLAGTPDSPWIAPSKK